MRLAAFRASNTFRHPQTRRHLAFLTKVSPGIYDNSCLEDSSTAAIMEPMIDLAMDLCALCAVQLGFGSFVPRRLLAAEAILAACSLLTAKLGPPGIAVRLAIPLLSASVLVGARRPTQAAEAGICLLCAYAASAGLAALGGTVLAPLGALALLALVRRRRNARCRWNVELYVELGGAGDRFPALIDTGNRLRDHRSGLPVLIVEAAAVPRFAAMADRLGPSAGRSLPFGVLGSAGELRGFRPDRVEIWVDNQPPRIAPACLVAPFPGRIPGPTRALAPPEFIDAASPAHILPDGFKFSSRRFRHGVIKRPAIHLRSGRTVSEGIGLLHRGK